MTFWERLGIALFLLALPMPAWAQSALQTLADSMAPGTWANLDVGGVSNLLEAPGTSTGNIFPDTDKGCWDPVRKEAHFIGRDHISTATPAKHVRYSEATNSWELLASPPWPGNIHHGWDGCGIDARGRVFYKRITDSNTLWRFNLDTQVWTNMGNGAGADTSQYAGMGFFYERGSKGIVIMPQNNSGTTGELFTFDPVAGTHGNIGSFNPCDSNGQVWYSEPYNRVYFGCQQLTSFFSIEPTGNTITQRAAKPCETHYNRTAIVHADPVSGDLIMLCETRTWHVYNPAANTWTAQPTGTSLPANHIFTFQEQLPGEGEVWAMIGIEIPTHGVIMYVQCNASQQCAHRLYKHRAFTAADRDWVQRKFGPGVLRAEGMDRLARINPGGCSVAPCATHDWNIGPMGFFPATGGSMAMDTSTRASGAGSIRITTNAGANDGGAFFANFRDNWSMRKGSNQPFYVAYRLRMDTAMYTLTGPTAPAVGMKQSILSAGSSGLPNESSCTDLETVWYNGNGGHFGMPQLYQNCGRYDPLVVNENGVIKLQNVRPAPYCNFEDNPNFFTGNGNCIRWVPNEWQWLKLKVSPGPVGTCVGFAGTCFTNSRIEGWHAREGTAAIKIIDITGYSIGPMDNASRLYGQIWLLPFLTDPTYPTQATVWYDELIISEQDIADPGQATPPPTGSAPLAPTNLQVVPL